MSDALDTVTLAELRLLTDAELEALLELVEDVRRGSIPAQALGAFVERAVAGGSRSDA